MHILLLLVPLFLAAKGQEQEHQDLLSSCFCQLSDSLQVGVVIVVAVVTGVKAIQ